VNGRAEQLRKLDVVVVLVGVSRADTIEFSLIKVGRKKSLNRVVETIALAN
jgi:hypothetical protein